MRRQAERWGAELFQEDVESIDVKSSPFTVKSSEHKVIYGFIAFCSMYVAVVALISTIEAMNCLKNIYLDPNLTLNLPMDGLFCFQNLSAMLIECDTNIFLALKI